MQTSFAISAIFLKCSLKLITLRRRSTTHRLARIQTAANFSSQPRQKIARGRWSGCDKHAPAAVVATAAVHPATGLGCEDKVRCCS